MHYSYFGVIEVVVVSGWRDGRRLVSLGVGNRGVDGKRVIRVSMG